MDGQWLAPYSEGADGRKQEYSGPSYHGFQVGPHYVFHPTQPGEVQQAVHLHAPTLLISPQSFQCDIQADLVSILEAIRQCLFRNIDPNPDAIDFMGLDSGTEHFGREPEQTDRWMLEPRLLHTSFEGEIDLMGDFTGQIVVGQS